MASPILLFHVQHLWIVEFYAHLRDRVKKFRNSAIRPDTALEQSYLLLKREMAMITIITL
jgi:hypothetical protein